jgi:hypothetical protein
LATLDDTTSAERPEAESPDRAMVSEVEIDMRASFEGDQGRDPGANAAPVTA